MLAYTAIPSGYRGAGNGERLAEVLGFPVEQCRSITRAVDEALTNIVRHSYSNRLDQPIACTFEERSVTRWASSARAGNPAL